MEYKDYYKVMGLDKTATDKEIKLAYRRLARKYHPDLNKDADAESKFKELGEAYEALKDPEKRKVYDQYARDYAMHQQNRGHYQQQQAWGQGFAGDYDASSDFFESLFGQRFRQQPATGADLRGNIPINLEDAFNGVSKDLTLPGAEAVRVKIPAGVNSGQQLRLAGKGQPGQNGGARGDLYITVTIDKHPLYDVMGNDIYLTLPITPWEAALGTTIMVPTLAGKVDLKIPPGSQGGQTLRLKKRGMPGSQPGDQYILLKIVIPQPTTDAAKLLYQNMAKEMPFNPREMLGG